jgi:signal transduction histidine kinase
MSTSSLRILLAQMNIRSTWLHRSIYFLTVGLMYLAILLRSIIGFQDSPQLSLVLILLFFLAVLFLGSTFLAHDSPWIFTVLISFEVFTILALLLITHSIRSDLFAFLFAITAMQVMQEYNQRITAAVIGVSAIITFLSLFQIFGILQALALTLVYNALSVFLAVYIWSTRQARIIQDKQFALTAELQEANHKLDDYARRAQQLTTSRERQRLARELHDSVSQTIFSMTLAAQIARKSMKSDHHKVAAQLDRLDYLTQSALSEMQMLVSHLAPEDQTGDFLEDLKQHLAERERLDNVCVALNVNGDGSLTKAEEISLYRIAQEALNNIVKHAHTPSAVLRLHLIEPFWMEIEDHGIGFNPYDIKGDEKMGVEGMRERAAEIGWDIKVISHPGCGTLIHVWKGELGK